MKSRLLVTALACVLLAAPANAVSLKAFSSFYVLGDSLSDTGNVYDALQGLYPESPPYWHGRFSNGPIWADRVARKFDRRGIRTDNLAWGGALANRPGADVGTQASQYRLIDRDKRGDRPLVALWAGGNDILQAAGKPDARAEGRKAARAVGDAAQSLRRAGVDDVLIFDMPDLGEIPKFGSNADKAASASAASRVFNRQLRKQVEALEDRGVRVFSVSAATLFEALLDDPRSFGVRNVRRPCLDGDDVCTRRQGLRRAFFDEIHPNLRVHSALADAALAAIKGGPAVARQVADAVPAPSAATVAVAPVPLPASGLMLFASVGLAGLWRRWAVRAPR